MAQDIQDSEENIHHWQREHLQNHRLLLAMKQAPHSSTPIVLRMASSNFQENLFTCTYLWEPIMKDKEKPKTWVYSLYRERVHQENPACHLAKPGQFARQEC